MVPDVDIIVPVLWRPDNARLFVASLRASLDDPRRVAVTAVASHYDRPTLRAWQTAGADVISEPGLDTFPAKVNHAYRHLADARPGPAPFLLLLGDDVAFHPGWLDAVLEVWTKTGADVICTNDLGFHKDATGGTHPLIARSYIDELGASWDGPGVVCHEGYRHNYVDAEIMAKGKHHDTWAPAPLAVIEHLHHQWRKAPVDATYQLGTDSLHRDRDLFYARLAIYRPPA